MVEVHILFYLLSECQTVHFRHHKVADHKVGFVPEHFVKSQFAVLESNDSVMGGKFILKIVSYLRVILSNEDSAFCGVKLLSIVFRWQVG